VNGAGCFVFGLVWSLAAERFVIAPETRIVVLLGFLGAFTTFSSFAFETFSLLRDGQVGLATLNVSASIGLGLAAVWLGIRLAQLL